MVCKKSYLRGLSYLFCNSFPQEMIYRTSTVARPNIMQTVMVNMVFMVLQEESGDARIISRFFRRNFVRVRVLLLRKMKRAGKHVLNYERQFGRKLKETDKRNAGKRQEWKYWNSVDMVQYQLEEWRGFQYLCIEASSKISFL